MRSDSGVLHNSCPLPPLAIPAHDARGSRMGLAIDLLFALLLALLTVVSTIDAAHAQAPLPDLDVTLVLEVQDTAGWLGLHDTVLGTTSDAPKPLQLIVPAVTGGIRSLTIRSPKFTTSFVLNAAAIKVVMTGRVLGAEALRGLSVFEQAVFDMQVGKLENQVTLVYGLSELPTRIVELHVTRP
jgi:hypothetical protein